MQATYQVRPLRTEEDYEAALDAIRPYFDAEPAAGTPQADHFDLLAMVILAYEDKHYPLPESDPVAVVNLIMESNGYTRADLAQILGGQSRVSEFLKGRRDLSLSQIRRLRDEWNIPADALIGTTAQSAA